MYINGLVLSGKILQAYRQLNGICYADPYCFHILQFWNIWKEWQDIFH